MRCVDKEVLYHVVWYFISLWNFFTRSSGKNSQTLWTLVGQWSHIQSISNIGRGPAGKGAVTEVRGTPPCLQMETRKRKPPQCLWGFRENPPREHDTARLASRCGAWRALGVTLYLHEIQLLFFFSWSIYSLLFCFLSTRNTGQN